MKVQFKSTPTGEVAILPRKEYERLKGIEQEHEEDADAERLIAQAKRELAGGAPLLPFEVVERLAQGCNPVRVLRQFRKLTQAELVAEIGITQHYLSDLETGKRKGPLELHRKIARHLGVPLDLLAPVSDLADAPSGRPVRSASAKPRRGR